jgi:hypothetical protein
MIVAGSQRSELMFKLHRRGYSRVATTTTCGLPDGQYDVALVDWRQHSIKALETTLDWLVHFLTPSGVLVAWLDPQERAGNRKLRAMLEEHGFVVEAGTVRRCGAAMRPLPGLQSRVRPNHVRDRTSRSAPLRLCACTADAIRRCGRTRSACA